LHVVPGTLKPCFPESARKSHSQMHQTKQSESGCVRTLHQAAALYAWIPGKSARFAEDQYIQRPLGGQSALCDSRGKTRSLE